MRRKETQLLVENWRSFVNNPSSLINHKNAMNSNIIIESRVGQFNGTFENALTEVKRGNIRSELLIETIIGNLENDIMLNEGVFDTLKSWVESGKGAISGAVKAAMEKVNAMYEKATLQIWNVVCLGKAQITKLERPLNALNGKIQKLKQSHPSLFLIMKVLLIIMVLITITIMTAPAAEAKISGASEEEVKAAFGYLKKFVNDIPAEDYADNMEGTMKKVNKVREALQDLLQKYESQKTYQPSELDKLAQFALKKGVSFAQDASQSGPDSVDSAWVQKLWSVAKSKLNINNVEFPSMK